MCGVWVLSIVVSAWSAVASAQTPSPLQEAIDANNRGQIQALLEEGADPWPPLDRLRRDPQLKPGVRSTITPLLEAVLPSPAQIAVADRPANAELSWLDEQLLLKLEQPLLCAGLQANDAWLVSEALSRGEIPASCGDRGATLIAAPNPELLTLLLDAGATVDACALSTALSADQVASVELLLRAGASPRFGCDLVPLFAARSEPMVRALLRSSSLDPFEPSLQIETYLRDWRFTADVLAVTTHYTERREMILAWAWVAGVSSPELFAPFLPGIWSRVPHRATPGVGVEAFEEAWTTAGGAEALLASREGNLGEPLGAFPCDVPASPSEARGLIGGLNKTSDGDHHRWYEGKRGHYHQRSVDGRWETASWSADLASCPELLELQPLLPALLGAHPWVTNDGLIFSVEANEDLPSGHRLSVGLP